MSKLSGGVNKLQSTQNKLLGTVPGVCCCSPNNRAYRYGQCCGDSSNPFWVLGSALGISANERPCPLIILRGTGGTGSSQRCFYFTGEVYDGPIPPGGALSAFAPGDGCASISNPNATGRAICDEGLALRICTPCSGVCCLGNNLPYCTQDSPAGFPPRRCNLGNKYRIRSTREYLRTVTGFRDVTEYEVQDAPPQYEGGPLHTKCFGWNAGEWARQRIRTELDATIEVRPSNPDPNNPGVCIYGNPRVHSARLIVEDFYKTAQFLRLMNTYVDPLTGQDTGLAATYSYLEGVDPSITDERRDVPLTSAGGIAATGYAAYFVFAPEVICHEFPTRGYSCCNEQEIYSNVTTFQSIYETHSLTSLYDCESGYSLSGVVSRQASCRGTLDPIPVLETRTETYNSINYEITVEDETYCNLAREVPPAADTQPLGYQDGAAVMPQVPTRLPAIGNSILGGCISCRKGPGL